MSTYLLDTNICIYAIKGVYPALEQKLLHIPPTKIKIPCVVVYELEYGVIKSKWSEQNRDTMLRFISAFDFLPFTEQDALIAARIRHNLERQGTPIGAYDLLIAATALARDYTLVTHNTKEFARIPNLKLADWTTV